MTPDRYLEIHLGTLRSHWESVSKRAVWQLTLGGGVENIHILDTLRGLQTLYYQIASATDALRHTKPLV